MQPNENHEEFYSRFHEQLLESQSWPGPYLFKFISREGEGALDKIKDLFQNTDAAFSQKQSKKKTFVSLSVRVTMEDPDQVIKIYKEVQKMKGVITL